MGESAACSHPLVSPGGQVAPRKVYLTIVEEPGTDVPIYMQQSQTVQITIRDTVDGEPFVLQLEINS